MSSRNASGVPVPATAVPTPSKAHQRHASGSTSSATAKPPKSSPGGQQQKQNLGVSTSSDGISSSTSSASFFPASKPPNQGDATPVTSSSMTPAGKDASKIFRRESSKTKPQGDRKSIFGWLRHHIVDTNDSIKASSAAGGSSKKKPETAESYARMNNLSDSMPSLIVQLNASGVPRPPAMTSSSGAANQNDAVMTSSSPAVSDDVINYRIRKKTSVAMVPNDSYSGGSARVKSSRSMRTLSGRNRWSSYDITGGVLSGLPQVVIEDSDEMLTGDDVEGIQKTSMRLATVQHHLLSESVSSSGRAHSVEALFIGGPCSEHVIDPSARLIATDSGLLVSNEVSESDSAATVSFPASPAMDTNGFDEHRQLIEKCRQVDERIEKARGDRNQLLNQLMQISAKEATSPKWNGDDRSRELLFGTLNEVDRLTAHLVDLLRSSAVSYHNDVFAPNEMKNDVTDVLAPDAASMQLFQEIGIHLHHQLTLLKKTIASPETLPLPTACGPRVAPASESLSNDLVVNRVLNVDEIIILPPKFQEQNNGETAS